MPPTPDSPQVTPVYTAFPLLKLQIETLLPFMAGCYVGCCAWLGCSRLQTQAGLLPLSSQGIPAAKIPLLTLGLPPVGARPAPLATLPFLPVSSGFCPSLLKVSSLASLQLVIQVECSQFTFISSLVLGGGSRRIHLLRCHLELPCSSYLSLGTLSKPLS